MSMEKQLSEDKQRLSEALGQEGKSIFTRVHYFSGVEARQQLLEEIIEDLQDCWKLPSTLDNTILLSALSSKVDVLLTKYQHKLKELEDTRE